MLDLRDQPRLPAALEAFRRQHPSVPVLLLLVVSRSEHHARGDASRREGVPAVPRHGRGTGRRARAASPSPGTPARSATCSPSSGPRAAWARPRRPSTWRPSLRTCARAACCWWTSTWPTATPPSTSAPSRSSPSPMRWRTPIGSTRRSSRASASRPRPARNCWRLPTATLALLVDAGRVRALIEAAARHYRYVVLDLCRTDPAVLDGLDPVKKILVIANQELATVRGASRMADTLNQRYGKDRVVLAVSRYDPNAGIGQEDIERVVGSKIRHLLPSDYRVALEALNTGRPLAMSNQTRLAGALKILAHELAEVPDDADVAEGHAGASSAG